MQSVGH